MSIFIALLIGILLGVIASAVLRRKVVVDSIKTHTESLVDRLEAKLSTQLTLTKEAILAEVKKV